MAIWQYTLTVIPSAGIRGELGNIPEQLYINKEGWEEVWAEEFKLEEALEPTFEDAYTIDWWNCTNVASAPIAAQIDRLIQWSRWGEPEHISWKGDANNKEDHDCSMDIYSVTHNIEKIQFRTDMRNVEKAYTFLSAMLRICAEGNLMVMDTSGRLQKPDIVEVSSSLKNSSAIRFLTNPSEFLQRVLQEQKDK